MFDAIESGVNTGAWMREMRNKSKSSMLEACGIAYLRCWKMSRRTEARPRRRDQRTESDISMTPEKERGSRNCGDQ